MSILLKKRTMIQYGVIPSCMLWFLFGTLACACLDTSRLATLAETSTRQHRKQAKRKIQSRAVAESPAEPLGRTSASTLGSFLDRFRFWPFVGAPPCGIVSPRIITVSLRVRSVRTIIKSGQPRKLTNLIPICYPVYAPRKL